MALLAHPSNKQREGVYIPSCSCIATLSSFSTSTSPLDSFKISPKLALLFPCCSALTPSSLTANPAAAAPDLNAVAVFEYVPNAEPLMGAEAEANGNGDGEGLGLVAEAEDVNGDEEEEEKDENVAWGFLLVVVVVVVAGAGPGAGVEVEVVEDPGSSSAGVVRLGVDLPDVKGELLAKSPNVACFFSSRGADADTGAGAKGAMAGVSSP